MKQLLLIMLVCYSAISFGQAPAVAWQKNYGGSGIDDVLSVSQTSDGGFIMAGYTKSNDNDVDGQNYLNEGGWNTEDYWVIKTDPFGNIVWKKTFGGSESDFAYSIQQTTDGYILTGYTNSTGNEALGNHGYTDALILKLDADGDLVWRKIYGGNGIDELISIQQTADGGYIACGATSSTDGDLTGIPGSIVDCWIVKFFPDGSIDWQRKIGGSNQDHAQSIRQTSDGGYVFAGSTNSTEITGGDNLNNYLAVKLSASGSTLWQYQFGGTGSDYAYDIIQLTPGEYAMAGHANSISIPNQHGYADGWIFRFNDSGTILWQRSLGGSKEDIIKALTKDADGNIIAIGQTKSQDLPGIHSVMYDAWVIKLDASNGNTLWEKMYGGTSADFGNSIAVCADGSLVFAGSVGSVDGDASQNFGSIDCWLVKLEPETLSRTDFHAGQMKVYPNPATQKINIEFPDGGLLQNASITDVNGKKFEVQTQLNTVDIQDLAIGTYFLQCTDAGGTTYTNTIIKK